MNTKEKTASKVNESEWEGKYKQKGEGEMRETEKIIKQNERIYK